MQKFITKINATSLIIIIHSVRYIYTYIIYIYWAHCAQNHFNIVFIRVVFLYHRYQIQYNNITYIRMAPTHRIYFILKCIIMDEIVCRSVQATHLPQKSINEKLDILYQPKCSLIILISINTCGICTIYIYRSRKKATQNMKYHMI